MFKPFTFGCRKDMPSKKCEAEGCNKWASFNLPGLKRPLFCRPHSTEGMVNVVSRQRCTYPDCPKQANFNHAGGTEAGTLALGPSLLNSR